MLNFCNLIVTFFHPPTVIIKSVYVSRIQMTTHAHSGSWLSDWWLCFPYSKLQSSGQVVLSTMYGLHASQSHMSFMCQTESKQRHEGSFRVACFSFLRAKATWEACVSTTENGGQSSCQGPHKPKKHPCCILLGAEQAKKQLQLQWWWRGQSGEKANVCWVHMFTEWRTCKSGIYTEWISHTVTHSVPQAPLIFLCLRLCFFPLSCCPSFDNRINTNI